MLALSKGLSLARILIRYRFGVMPKVTVIAGSSPVVPTTLRAVVAQDSLGVDNLHS